MTTPAAYPESLPPDLQLPAGFVFAPLSAQIAAAREDLHRWIAVQGPRVDRKHGGISPVTYAAGVQVRKSILHTLLRLESGVALPGEFPP